MFRSKKRPIVFPQSEHARLAGIIAAHWGNQNFDLPPIDRDSFLTGVYFHDRGYPEFDDLEIGATPIEAWIQVNRAGALAHYDDAVANMLVMLHVRRLLRYSTSAEREACVEEIDAEIERCRAKLPVNFEMLLWADSITNFCDNVSFEFCFEHECSKTFQIHPHFSSSESVTIRYSISVGTVQLDPWPLSVPNLSGVILAYEAEGYPTRREPRPVEFSISPKLP